MQTFPETTGIPVVRITGQSYEMKPILSSQESRSFLHSSLAFQHRVRWFRIVPVFRVVGGYVSCVRPSGVSSVFLSSRIGGCTPRSLSAGICNAGPLLEREIRTCHETAMSILPTLGQRKRKLCRREVVLGPKPDGVQRF